MKSLSTHTSTSRLFGYDQGVMGGLLTLNSFVKTFPQIDTTKAGEVGLSAAERSTRSTIQGMSPNLWTHVPDTNRLGITTASYNLGCFCGAIFCIWIGNYLGRRRTIFTGSIIMVIGASLQACAYSLPHLIVGRIVTGIGNGMNTSTVRKYRTMLISNYAWCLTYPKLHGSPSAASPITVVGSSCSRVL